MHRVLVEKAANLAHTAIFANHGQNCCAGSRTFVHEKIYDQFVNKATQLAAARKVSRIFYFIILMQKEFYN